MVDDVACIVCGSRKNATRHESTFSGSAAQAPEYFLSHRKKVAHGRVVNCLDCGFIYTSPQFSPAEYDLIYQTAPQRPPGEVDFLEAEKLRFSRLAAFVRKHAKPGSFLDFGCGDGGFLDIMNDERGQGFDVGEPGMRSSAGGRVIVTGNFSNLQEKERFTDGAFSFVTAFDVFEHLPDLPLYLDQMHRIIQKHGHLIVTVPNADSVAAKITGERWNMILLEHLWYFSPDTLKRLVSRHGFEHVETRSMPYEASLSHIFNRLAQTYHLSRISLPKVLASLTIPLPIGLMASVFRRT
jgi:SAM-dependent methyltransferase